jgi:hypothetical protein
LQEDDARNGNYTLLHGGDPVGWVYKQRPDAFVKGMYRGAFDRILKALIPISLFWMCEYGDVFFLSLLLSLDLAFSLALFSRCCFTLLFLTIRHRDARDLVSPHEW